MKMNIQNDFGFTQDLFSLWQWNENDSSAPTLVVAFDNISLLCKENQHK